VRQPGECGQLRASLAGGLGRRFWHAADHAKQRGAADRYGHLLDQPGTDPPTQCYRHRLYRLLGRCGAAAVPHGQADERLGEDFLAQSGWSQNNRRARSVTSTSRPPMAESTSRLAYRLCTRAETTPQPGHSTPLLVVAASTRTRAGL